MGTTVMTVFHDDIDHKTLDEVHTRVFVVDEVAYEIDLSEAHSAELDKVLAKFVASARVISTRVNVPKMVGYTRTNTVAGKPPRIGTQQRKQRGKLSPEQVMEIKGLLHEGQHSKGELAEKFGVTPQTIGNIENGLSWGHVIFKPSK